MARRKQNTVTRPKSASRCPIEQGVTMSDMTNLSNDYSASADFAKEFNRAVLLLKQKHLEPGRVNELDVSNARTGLSRALAGLLAQLPPEGEASDEGLLIPLDVLERLQERTQGKMEWFKDDLRSLKKALDEDSDLEDKDFTVLDDICDAADATASASFRRLWRR
jgi:hypothetical protein